MFARLLLSSSLLQPLTPAHSTPSAGLDAHGRAACSHARSAPPQSPSALPSSDPLLQLVLQEDRRDVLVTALRDQDLDRPRGNASLSLLTVASAAGRQGTVELLLELGAALEKADRHGETALTYALRHGQAASTCALLRHGAKWPDRRRFSDLLPATQLTNDGAAATLLASLLLQRGFSVNARLQGDTALHLALQLGHRGSVALLLQHGADTKALDHRGLSAIDIAKQSDISDWLRAPDPRVTAPTSPPP